MKNIAVLNIDMVKDSLTSERSPVFAEGRAIIPATNHLLREARKSGMQVIFATDSFLPEDYFFSAGKKPYSVRGTRGAEVFGEMEKGPDDLFLAKRRFSAFYKTDLDQVLRVKGIDTVALTGISTPVCVLATAFDGLSHDFRVVLIEDCCAAQSKEIHRTIVEAYRKTPLYPFFKIMTSEQFLSENCGKG